MLTPFVPVMELGLTIALQKFNMHMKHIIFHCNFSHEVLICLKYIRHNNEVELK